MVYIHYRITRTFTRSQRRIRKQNEINKRKSIGIGVILWNGYRSEKLIKEARQKLDSKRKANAKLLSFNEEEDDDDIIPITHYKPKRRNLNEDSATNEKYRIENGEIQIHREKEKTDDKAISKCVDEWKEKQEEIKKEKISV